MFKKNNVVFVSSQLGGGGAERVISILANHMVKMGWHVNIYLLYDKPIVYQLDNRINLFCQKCKRKRFLGAIQQIIALRSFFRKNNPDVIISFLTITNMVSILSNLFSRIPIIVSERNDPNINPKSSFLRFIRDLLYHFSNGIVLQTHDADEYFKKKGLKSTKVIPNPLSSKLIPPYRGKRRKSFVTAIRLDQQKNVDMLLNAFKMASDQLKGFSLEIYGTGPEEERLKHLSFDLGLSSRVFFAGFSNNLHEQIADAYAFVLPSDYEGLSNSMIEALALGLPTISTDHPIGGARMFIIDGYNGLLVPVGDTTRLAEAMVFLANNPQKAMQFSDNAILIRNELEISKIYSKWEEYLYHIM